MIDLDLYVDALLFGSVLGVSVGDDHMRVEQILGSDFIEEVSKKRWMRRDYGLMEFNFSQVDGVWSCVGLSVQLHRLSISSLEMIVPKVIADHFGNFRAGVKIDKLMDHMRVRGYSYSLFREKMDSSFEYFGVKDAKGKIIVVGKGSDDSTSTAAVGHIWSIEVLR